MTKELKEFLLSNRASIAQIKEFLGYEPTDAVLDNLNVCVWMKFLHKCRKKK